MLMHPFKHHGIFKDTMTKDLQVLRKNQDIILAALTVFVSEPTMVSWYSIFQHKNLVIYEFWFWTFQDWIKDTERVKGENFEGLAKHRIQSVKDKLNLQNPCLAIISQLQKYSRHKLVKDKNVEFLRRLSSQFEQGKVMDEDRVTSILIELATNEAILSRTYTGWSPHLWYSF